MNKKRIAFIVNSSIGLLKFRRELIKEVKKEGHCLFGVAPYFNREEVDELINLGVTPIVYNLSRTGKNPVRELISIISISTKIKRIKPDLLFCFQLKPAIYGTIAAAINGIKDVYVMIEGLGYVFTADKVDSKILKKMLIVLMKIAFARSKKIFFLNSDDQDEFIKLKIVKPEKAINLRGIGVDLSYWSYSEPNISDLSFIFVGRLLKEKGIMEFLNAAKTIKTKYPYVKFYVLGKLDSNPGSIKKEDIISFVEEGYVEWTGFVDVKPWLQRSSVFVLPSYREGVPRSTQEAMAIGRAIITTDAPGCRDTVMQGKNGFFVPPRNVLSLVKAMEVFINNPDLIKIMGQESRKIAELKFNADDKNKIILENIGLSKKDLGPFE